MIPVFRLTAPLLFLLLSACAAQMYEGARRSDRDVAFIHAKGDGRIEIVDGAPGRGSSTFAVLPGVHKLTLVQTGIHLTAEGSFYSRASHEPITVCFRAHSGHSYQARLAFDRELLRPEISDDDGSLIPARRIGSQGEGCLAEGGGSHAQAGDDDPFASRDATRAVAQARSAFYEDPNAPAAPKPAPRLDSVADRVKQAGTGFHMGLGRTTGGDPFVTTGQQPSTLSTGDGAVVSLGGEWSPLRTSGGHALGLGLDVGLRYELDNSNGGMWFLCLPVALSAQAWVHGARGFFVVFQTGVQKDFMPTLSSDRVLGPINPRFKQGLGPFGGFGGYWQIEHHFGVSLSMRVTVMHYTQAERTVDAMSIGGGVAFHFTP
jgi:hypothetical protein